MHPIATRAGAMWPPQLQVIIAPSQNIRVGCSSQHQFALHTLCRFKTSSRFEKCQNYAETRSNCSQFWRRVAQAIIAPHSLWQLLRSFALSDRCSHYTASRCGPWCNLLDEQGNIDAARSMFAEVIFPIAPTACAQRYLNAAPTILKRVADTPCVLGCRVRRRRRPFARIRFRMGCGSGKWREI